MTPSGPAHDSRRGCFSPCPRDTASQELLVRPCGALAASRPPESTQGGSMYRLVALAAALAAFLSACTPAASTQPSSPRGSRNPAALVSPWVGAAPMLAPPHDSHLAAL